MLILCFDISITLSTVSFSVNVSGPWLRDQCHDSIGPVGPTRISGPNGSWDGPRDINNVNFMFWYFYYSAVFLFLWLFQACDSMTGAVTASGPSGPLKFRVPMGPETGPEIFSPLIMLILCFDIFYVLIFLLLSVMFLFLWLFWECDSVTSAMTSSGLTEVTGLTIYMGPLITLGL